jgi:hypothetical protein
LSHPKHLPPISVKEGFEENDFLTDVSLALFLKTVMTNGMNHLTSFRDRVTRHGKLIPGSFSH